MTTTTERLDAIEALARAATREPEERPDLLGWTEDPCPTCGGWHPVSHDCGPSAATYKLQIALSPDVALALVAVARALPDDPFTYMSTHVGPDGDDVYEWSCYSCSGPMTGGVVEHSDDCEWRIARSALDALGGAS